MHGQGIQEVKAPTTANAPAVQRLQTLRRNARQEREARGWSMGELAQAAGLTPTIVYRLEKGSNPPRLDRPSRDTQAVTRAQSAVSALGVDPGLRASLGLKRAESARLWELSDRLEEIGIYLDTPLQAIRALDFLRSLDPSPGKAATESLPVVGRQRPDAKAECDGSR